MIPPAPRTYWRRWRHAVPTMPPPRWPRRARWRCRSARPREAMYRDLLRRWRPDVQAGAGLAGLLESLGRGGELAPLFDQARAAGARPAIGFLGDAIALREAGSFAAAFASDRAGRGLLPEGSWQQLRGELADRAGDQDKAFDAFAAMNAADALGQR